MALSMLLRSIKALLTHPGAALCCSDWSVHWTVASSMLSLPVTPCRNARFPTSRPLYRPSAAHPSTLASSPPFGSPSAQRHSVDVERHGHFQRPSVRDS
ncbi:hypothetical protein CALVIDRAFT_426152 [Calocera viscosa TUFC12733]|uniref:Secreted protein n=1 Tax=Calocera viscosa (strain TUFC12733) TaxID=1330018 RepID=A0A167PJZ7_CALVF|nr:hypothetical protein CALVIDRAFT_426152 [Calocera viscosa TUFC12733]